MPERRAKAYWEGPVKEGYGWIAVESGVVEAEYSFGSRFENRKGTPRIELQTEGEVLGTGAENNLFMARWKRGGNRYVVLVNGESSQRSISDSTVLQSLNVGKLKPWKFTRADVLDGEMRHINKVNLQPWEVAVWQVLDN